ncbi:MAG: type II/IV secretion system protein [Candidatus Yonathbacteria bacterium]|nr:type II/IV secretion system protein [Candidatus Yonathbacteria bacterium]
MTFLEQLAQQGVIKKEDILSVNKESRTTGESVDSVLVRMGVEPRNILKVKGDYFKLPTRRLENDGPAFEILKYIPEESATYYKFVPLGLVDSVLEVGVVDPDNIAAKDALQFISARVNKPFKIFLILDDDFEKVIKNYRGLTGEVTRALSELETEIKDVKNKDIIKKDQEAKKEAEHTQESAKIVEDAPVTKIVAVILRHATEGNASDVHIEHMGDRVRARFRVDGVLYTSLLLPVGVHSAVVARIKILANLKLDEKRKPQDGRFSARIEGRQIDFRVSTFPAFYGEKVVMRILDTERGVKPLDQIGMRTDHLELIREAINKPYGIILITGPTGSGKSTTLYSMVNELDREESNVVSLEDPVEYNMPGMSQSQVRPEIDYTFANGLRSILRQDPDIIMVGEIRDKETAQLAIQAALTGHLVLSTLHTNSAIGAIPRLVDMGVDPYLIAPTLILSIAQRLVRVLCADSKKPIPMEGGIKMMVEKQFADLPEKIRQKTEGKTFYEAVPSPTCPGGTRGRLAVFEILKVDKEIENVILKNPTEPEILKVARKNGMTTMREDATLKALDGIIPFEEVNKV